MRKRQMDAHRNLSAVAGQNAEHQPRVVQSARQQPLHIRSFE
jgi:hypothetical protein